MSLTPSEQFLREVEGALGQRGPGAPDATVDDILSGFAETSLDELNRQLLSLGQETQAAFTDINNRYREAQFLAEGLLQATDQRIFEETGKYDWQRALEETSGITGIFNNPQSVNIVDGILRPSIMTSLDGVIDPTEAVLLRLKSHEFKEDVLGLFDQVRDQTISARTFHDRSEAKRLELLSFARRAWTDPDGNRINAEEVFDELLFDRDLTNRAFGRNVTDVLAKRREEFLTDPYEPSGPDVPGGPPKTDITLPPTFADPDGTLRVDVDEAPSNEVDVRPGPPMDGLDPNFGAPPDLTVEGSSPEFGFSEFVSGFATTEALLIGGAFLAAAAVIFFMNRRPASNLPLVIAPPNLPPT